ncbi:RNA-binding protein [Bacillus sp. AGMB 02131]|uniref:RNA-binding protein n=1 Tax=Peribacillus faecalis TaxID=2772559 RepID=A0A927H8S2_9BACI|nr:RNA-binding protein [Peribacillus faecalis]MBD3106805.1 RNA-binding protein [Peribacillus faecalis]
MNIYQHFRKEEKAFIDQCMQWQEQVVRQYTPRLTAFLTPREQQILASIIGKNSECQVAFFGGSQTAERKRAFLYPEYYEASEADFNIAVLEIGYNSKFHELRHQQILGTMMSLGIVRDKFGDILIADNKAQAIVSDDISDYVCAHINKIANAGVALSKISIAEVVHVQEAWKDYSTTCSSLRLDTVLAAMTNLSRQKVQEAIAGGKVKVNHELIEENDFECGEADILSVRGLGRFKLMSINGKSKKEKWKISFGKQQ